MNPRRNRAGKWIALVLLTIWGGAMVMFLLMERRFTQGRKLILAAELGNTAEVERLVQAGAFTNMRNKSGYTALWLAASNGNTAVVVGLLRHGADPNQRSADGT